MKEPPVAHYYENNKHCATYLPFKFGNNLSTRQIKIFQLDQ